MSVEGLYPAPAPFDEGMLPLDSGHVMHWEQSGNPDGVPAVFLHGGPGGGTRPKVRHAFDPTFYRLVTFDQRGCGQSTPHGTLEGNTTAALIADIERLRAHLGIARWLITGGSWGSYLSLAYGQAHPDRCLGFRLHGIFLGRQDEIAWWFNGIGTLFPDRWRTFRDFLPVSEHDDLLAGYYRRLIDPDPEVHLPAAIALRTYSAWTQTFRPDPGHVATLTQPVAALAIARIFTHYCVNQAFNRPGLLLEGIDAIRHLPAIIVQGRYDVVTPMRTAWDLHLAWPEAAFEIVTEANHVASEPAMAGALMVATDRLKDLAGG